MTAAARTARSPGQKLPAANDHVADAAASAAAVYLSVLFMVCMDTWKRGIGATCSSSDPLLSSTSSFLLPLRLSGRDDRGDSEGEGSESCEERSEGFQWVFHVHLLSVVVTSIIHGERVDGKRDVRFIRFG